MRGIFVLAILAALPGAARMSHAEAKSPGKPTSGAEVIREMNLARQHPDIYAGYLEELRGNFRGNILLLPGRTMLRTREGVGAVDEAIQFLRRARPLEPLAFSAGISMAAAEHVADQASGAFGHGGSDHSNPGDRMNRYGTGALFGVKTFPTANSPRVMWSSP